MAVIEVFNKAATVENYKWTCNDRQTQESLQSISDTVRHKVDYGCFTESAIDNWIASYIAKLFSGKVLSYSEVEKIDYSKYPPGVVF